MSINRLKLNAIVSLYDKKKRSLSTEYVRTDSIRFDSSELIFDSIRFDSLKKIWIRIRFDSTGSQFGYDSIRLSRIESSRIELFNNSIRFRSLFSTIGLNLFGSGFLDTEPFVV
jgi:hypothetical protein